MTLTTTARNLSSLVDYSCSKISEKLQLVEEREKVALGALAPVNEGEESPENLAFGLYATMVGSMVSAPPEMSARSSGGRQERVKTAAMAAATTQIAAGSRMHRALEVCAWDFWFKPFMAGFVEMAPSQMIDLTDAEREMAKGRLGKLAQGEQVNVGGEPGDLKGPRATDTPSPELPAHWPRFKRLNPQRCGWDQSVDSFDEARFTYHEVIEDRADLIARAEEHGEDWILSAVQTAPRADMRNRASDDAGTYAREDDEYVRYFVVYVPGGKIDGEKPGPNQPGTIHTVSASGRAPSGELVAGVDLRRPYYFTGHPDGPHVFGGQYTTGADAMFLNLLGATEDSLAMLESVSASLHNRIRNHKSVTVYDQMAEEEVQKIAAAPDGDFVGVVGLGDRPGLLQQIETSVVSPAEVAEYRELQANAQRQLGISNETLGNSGGDVTATAVAEAAQQVDAKVEYLLARWNRFVTEALERMAFYVAMDDRVAVRLDDSGRASVLRAELQPIVDAGHLTASSVEQIVEQEKNTPLLWQGGDFDEAGQFDWYALKLEVKPSSMTGAQSRAAAQRETAWNMQLLQLGAAMVEQPHIRWIDRMKATGRAMGIDEAEMAVDIELAQMIAQVQLAQPSPSYTTASQAGGAMPPRQGALPQAPEPRMAMQA